MTTRERGVHRELSFSWLREDRPGPVWSGEFARTQESYMAWFRREGAGERPDLESCRAALAAHMPELVPLWEDLAELAGGGEDEARMLSLWCPTPYLSGCSQAVFARRAPILVRNYDYHPDLCEAAFLLSSWHGTRVVASIDCLWGALDGMNEYGLVLALSFGGRKEVGEGFGIPLILRYALEFSRSTPEAIDVLSRLPSHMTYNVSVLDAQGQCAVVAVAPDRAARVREAAVATNHQDVLEWTRYAKATRSVERERFLYERLADKELDAPAFEELFLQSPLYSKNFERGHGTLYTAVYRPSTGGVSWLWRGARRDADWESFEPSTLTVELPA